MHILAAHCLCHTPSPCLGHTFTLPPSQYGVTVLICHPVWDAHSTCHTPSPCHPHTVTTLAVSHPVNMCHFPLSWRHPHISLASSQNGPISHPHPSVTVSSRPSITSVSLVTITHHHHHHTHPSSPHRTRPVVSPSSVSRHLCHVTLIILAAVSPLPLLSHHSFISLTRHLLHHHYQISFSRKISVVVSKGVLHSLEVVGV